ncbi:MAG: heme-binding protein [Novosphingobium sp.]
MKFDLAQTILSAAQAAAADADVSVAIAVLDAGAHLVAFTRADGAPIGTIDVSQRKARTAALFQTDSADLGSGTGAGGASYTFEYTNGGLIVFGGGVAVRDASGAFLGAIGVAGATVDQDQAIAKAAAQALFA